MSKKRTRRPKNLLLDAEALGNGAEYCERHGTTLSRLVEDFLRSLWIPWEAEATSPIVQRLRGAARMGAAEAERDTYRDFVYGKRIEGDLGHLI